ncbi:sodium-dependent bicarbonate transport family permease [Candidatus Marinamargulisbacteria bacterium SCGC AAA071-K20]|nr:sodium-dependent bicarbonate transport family permease [Candidatus Marinamargulisbacteria bacterium SCGC AAA071-K20]
MDPVILFFIFGAIAGMLRAELRLPRQVYEFVTILLLLTIGLKGGIELAKQPFSTLLPQIAVVVAIGGFILPLIIFPILRYLGRFKRADAASISAHYGSVSVGTFAVVLAYVSSLSVPFEEYMALFVVLLEIPAILVGIILARGVNKETKWGKVAQEVLLGRGITLLIGGLLIGWIAGADGLTSIKPMFFDLFNGILALFLLEMGLITATQLSTLKKHGPFLIVFGVVMPVFLALIGTLMGWSLGLSVGGTAILATLIASASYIAVPAAMRISVPEANPTLSLTASLGITFPFNILVGVPMYYTFAEKAHILFGG